jgi:hypothetical protein
MTTGVTVVLVDRPAAPVPDDLPGALLTGALPVQVLVVDAGGGLAQRQRDGAFDVVTLPPVAPGRPHQPPPPPPPIWGSGVIRSTIRMRSPHRVVALSTDSTVSSAATTFCFLAHFGKLLP